MLRRTFITGLVLATAFPTFAAGSFTNYKPGIIKSALAKGETVFVDYATDWCGTCRTQERIIKNLIKANPSYKSKIKFVRVDWDQYSGAEVSTSRNIPRRSTLIMLRGDKELGRIVAGTSKTAIQALIEKGI